jgi:hypothetical protein
MKSKRLRRTAHVLGVEKERNACLILIGKQEGRR